MIPPKPAFFLFLLFPVISSQAFAISPPIQVKTYDELLHAIREVQHATQQRIEAAVESEKVREAWETGKLIDEHILLHKERAAYGEQVLERLSKDLGLSLTELQYRVQFARAYPISQPAGELSWSHYRALLALNDPREREEVTREAIRHHWNRDQVREEVRRRKPGFAGNPRLPEIKPGKVGVYRVVKINGKKYYDVGFSTYFEIKGKGPKQTNPLKEDLHTYEARALQVIDGDTFHARIDLGFGIMMEQRIRLLRIDAPEIESSEGKESKTYLEKILARDKGRILIQTSEIDQHGRPLANVWVKNQSIDQELLDSGWFTLRSGE